MMFDEKGENGLIVGGKYLPEELLAEIFCYVDCDSLLRCQIVCKLWKVLIQTYVWRKKVEILFGRSLLLNKNMPWYVHYVICKKKPFERNLIQNHSGEYGTQKYWKIISEGGDRWKVENPPIGVVPLPNNEPVFEGKQFCFVTSYRSCLKLQIIDLEVEGLSSYVLDNLQPPIMVSEWYSCRLDCPALYECTIKLLGEGNRIIDFFHFHDDIVDEQQNQWHRISHEFKNYGRGLRKIHFFHSGTDKLFWTGHYGSKMAGACVLVKVPIVQPYSSKEVSISHDID